MLVPGNCTHLELSGLLTSYRTQISPSTMVYITWELNYLN